VASIRRPYSTASWPYRASLGEMKPPDSAGRCESAIISFTVPAARRQCVAPQLVSRFHPAIRGAIPVGYIESASTFPAEDELLVKSFKWPAIEAVRLNGSNNSEFTV